MKCAGCREGLYDIIRFRPSPPLLSSWPGGNCCCGQDFRNPPAAALRPGGGNGFQVVLLGLLNVFFYLDKRNRVLLLTSLFTVLNLTLP